MKLFDILWDFISCQLIEIGTSLVSFVVGYLLGHLAIPFSRAPKSEVCHEAGPVRNYTSTSQSQRQLGRTRVRTRFGQS